MRNPGVVTFTKPLFPSTVLRTNLCPVQGVPQASHHFMRRFLLTGVVWRTSAIPFTLGKLTSTATGGS